ncbi:MAG: ASKHA domain-containing protein [Oscillospiraceae bacterium]|jgi:uncharacterized 2Fe-2S/4Fe-4S cluster protein (DUF4445 family)|nr:ASKHA domain-containing protein [Oscillospiraceae bacterium]
MTGGKCEGNCLLCGKCKGFAILDSYGEHTEGIEPREGCGIAVDVGTTTVVLALADLASGRCLSRASFMNPQRAFGPDVISRIGAANDGHLHTMKNALAEEMNKHILPLTERAGVTPREVTAAAVAGNTAMTYIMLGLPCESLGVLPFEPAFPVEPSYPFGHLFGECGVSAPTRVFPHLAPFVGGDITAGLLCALQEKAGRFLLMDLGTNGEMALRDGGKLAVTSSAAGPAFEQTCSGGASAALAELARLVRGGLVDESGLLQGDSAFTQAQVRALQLAKSAVRAGVELLMQKAGVDADGIDAVYLAGGIGQAIDVGDAVAVGLLPQTLARLARPAGNTSLGGAARYLAAPSRSDAVVAELTGAASHVNLAAHPRFNDLFMEYMGFDV